MPDNPSSRRPVAKAYVLADGQLVTDDYLQAYAVKRDSARIPEDDFKEEYGLGKGVVKPTYDPGTLSLLLDINPFHMRACKTKARDTAGLGWRLVPKDGVTKPNDTGLAECYEFLNDPHPRKTLEEILYESSFDYEGQGNGYIELVRDAEFDANGDLKGLAPPDMIDSLPAQTMRVHSDGKRLVQKREKKKRWFKHVNVVEDVHREAGNLEAAGEHAATEVIQIKDYTARSDFYGTPDIVSALGSLLGDRERQEYVNSFFENHAIPAYAVTVVGADIDPELEAKILKFFHEDVRKDRHATLVVTVSGGQLDEDGEVDTRGVQIKFEKLDVDVKEASFRLLRKDNRDEILSAHAVPPYRAGIAETGSLGGSTAREATEVYKQSVIGPRQRVLANRITRHILVEGFGILDYAFEFEAIDTRDEMQELQVAGWAFDRAALTPNQMRELRGDDTSPNAGMDEYYLGGIPLSALLEGGPAVQAALERAALLRAVKSLHGDLVQAALKGRNGAEPRYMTGEAARRLEEFA